MRYKNGPDEDNDVSSSKEESKDYRTDEDSQSNIEYSDTDSGKEVPTTRPIARPFEEDECVKALHKALRKIPGLEPYRDPKAARVIEYLASTVARLKVENNILREELDNAGETGKINPGNKTPSPLQSSKANKKDPAAVGAPTYETIHTVFCEKEGTKNHFRDLPRLFKGDSIEYDHLRGRIDTEDTSEYLQNNLKTAFVLNPLYTCNSRSKQNLCRDTGHRNGRCIKDSPPAESDITDIVLSPAIHQAIRTVMEAHPEHFNHYNSANLRTRYKPPYILFYIHNRTFLELSGSSGLDDWAESSLRLLCTWFEEHCRNDWDEGDALIARGKYNRKHYGKLFRPGELVVLPRDPDGMDFMTLGMVADYPWKNEDPYDTDIVTWVFNGSFIKLRRVISLGSDDDIEKDIATNLRHYPFRFAEKGIKDKLVLRGARFWACRKKKLVCYEESVDKLKGQGERRVMIDYDMYRRLHPGKQIFRWVATEEERNITDMDNPPNDDFLACLPPGIHGFDFSTKSWGAVLLRVDRITDVTWNKTAFKQLHISASPDIIEGKGQGLLILLHGCPGTGKTLTAESIAEEQERPLYRVTCGDIGIEPLYVETYLSNVLEIGKTWGCVVLLDEADVFLEERSYADQKRNAIISIFLRLLEYYSGILILTTNRIGAFDEAFKSRIQLALSYPRLDEESRLKIWHNFVQMLRKTKDRIDHEDLEMNLHKLAKVEMNGREIRNTITTARHLAKFRKEILRYKHMQDAVKSVQRFNQYLEEVKGVSDDDWARADRLR
ncbi:hypothetical protein MFIFM68171_06642 [Madurella fahalii]|uniref:AAA+ ATPase domain-containing protein n=1 Tax=Madurella fahalii TaxID=1157608 RepID=A0ABQ0GF95_9PEZI